jgi:Ca2+-binding EF-hand superfamily protein
LNTLGF